MMDTQLLRGLKVMVVEDEMLVAMLLEDILTDCGCELTIVSSVPKALELATLQELDAAILDENLSGQRSYPVADALASRGIPFMFATGYGDKDLARLYPGRPVLAKPYSEADLLATLTELCAQPGAT